MMYNPAWEENLHSNMVRFIIGVGDMYGHGVGIFTFQYG